ncbi:uncharacterized protein LOC123535017 [Mercenaria mercenaria]|uniref:uncharacterized protein LOC123535017 n=1 Tax=Mercenaria mercenaria TaxID=6596 RepID=UPI001E1D34AF|nr:uncharacterized protein LOC123535017 [Mercenaria mercenaria]
MLNYFVYKSVISTTILCLLRPTYSQTIDGCPMYGCRPSGTFSFVLDAPRVNATIGWVNDFFLGPIPEALGCVGNTFTLVCQSNGPGPGDTGLLALNLDTGSVRWRDMVLRFPTLPVLDEQGNLWGTDGSSLMHYDVAGKPMSQIELEPRIRPLFGLQYVDPDLLLFVSETGQISTRTSDGTPMAELYLKGTVERANGTFIPTAPAVVNGNRFYVLTEFAPDDNEQVANLGLQRLYAIDAFERMADRLVIAWYANFEKETAAVVQQSLKFKPKSFQKRLIHKIKRETQRKPSLLWDSFHRTVFVSLPPPVLSTREGQNGIESLIGIKDLGNNSALVFKVERSASNMVLYERNSGSMKPPANAGAQLWISLPDSKLLAIEPDGNISKAIDVSKILKTNFTITSKISSARSREIDEDFLIFGIKVTTPTEEFQKLVESYGIDTSEATPTCYVVGVDTPENTNVPNSMVWIVPTPDDIEVNGQIIGIKGDNTGRKDQIIAFAQMEERYGKIFSIV